ESADRGTDKAVADDIQRFQVIAGVDVLMLETRFVFGDDVNEKILYPGRVQIVGHLTSAVQRRRKVIQALHHFSQVSTWALSMSSRSTSKSIGPQTSSVRTR